MYTRFALSFLILTAALWSPVWASESHDSHGESSEAFNPSDFIIHHIADAHDIHLWGEGHSSVHIPLPIIVYSDEHGLDVHEHCF